MVACEVLGCSGEGILALLSTQGDASDPILVSIERTTGSVLQNLGALDLGSAYGITGSAAAAQRSVYVASSSHQTRDQLAWLRVDCTR